MTRLRLAVIGAGRLGGFHAQKAAANGRINLVGVVDPIEASRKRLAKECQTEPFESIDQLAWKNQRGGHRDSDPIPSPSRHGTAQPGDSSLGRKAALPDNRRGQPNGRCGRSEIEPSCKSVTSSGLIRRSARVRGSMTDPKYISATRASGFTFRSTDIGVVLDPDDPRYRSGAFAWSNRRSRRSRRWDFRSWADMKMLPTPDCTSSQAVSRRSTLRGSVPKRHDKCRSGRAAVGQRSISVRSNRRWSFRTTPSRERHFDIDSLSPEQIDHYREHFFEEALITKRPQFARDRRDRAGAKRLL